MNLPLALILLFALSAALQFVLLKSAHALHLVDNPGGDALKPHEQPIPNIGGLGWLLLFLPAAILLLRPVPWLMLGGLLLMSLVGAVDDRRPLPPRLRLVLGILAGCALAMSSVAPDGLLWKGLIIFMTVACVNAINMQDGLDGHAASLSLASLAGFAVILPGQGGITALMLIALVAGFLVWNWKPARMFMGDSGSYFLGYVVALLATQLFALGGLKALPVVLLLTLMPFLDIFVAMTRRKLAGKSPFEGDRSHLYDLLHQKLGSLPGAVLASAAMQFMATLLAIKLWEVLT